MSAKILIDTIRRSSMGLARQFLAWPLLCALVAVAPVVAAWGVTIQYSALLDGAQEVPAVATPGQGMAAVWLDTVTLNMTWDIEWWGLTGPATSAHFHGPGAVGVNAAVLYPIDHTVNPTTGLATISAAEAGDLAAELFYVNIHTAAHPGGEIRGQLRVAGSHQLSPILPNQDHSDRDRGVWVFMGADGGGAWFDPFVAIGFDFYTFDGSNFVELIMPVDVTDGPYSVSSAHGVVTVPAGGAYTFPAPVDRFSVGNILPGVDPGSPVAFPIHLTFDQQTVNFTMAAILIPEPASLIVLALASLGLAMRRKR